MILSITVKTNKKTQLYEKIGHHKNFTFTQCNHIEYTIDNTNSAEQTQIYKK